MEPFAMVSDLGDVENQATAGLALISATASIISALGWDPRESVRTLTTEAASCVFLPCRNVTAVSLSINSVPVATSDYLWNDTGHVTLLRGWGRRALITVTYTAGYPHAEIGDLLTAVCVEQAKRYLDTSNGLKSKSWALGAESESETYYDQSAGGLMSDPRLLPYALAPALA